MSKLTIGVVARDAGVNIDTLRFYERQGVVPQPPRTNSNYRIYPADTARRVRFVKRAQDLGFSLKEIKDLLALRVTQGATCEDVLQKARLKISEIDEKIRSLRAVKKALADLADECASPEGPVSECGVLKALD
jgi:MerR family mercuric resistance operon transcriptional regulator